MGVLYAISMFGLGHCPTLFLLFGFFCTNPDPRHWHRRVSTRRLTAIRRPVAARRCRKTAKPPSGGPGLRSVARAPPPPVERNGCYSSASKPPKRVACGSRLSAAPVTGPASDRGVRRRDPLVEEGVAAAKGQWTWRGAAWGAHAAEGDRPPLAAGDGCVPTCHSAFRSLWFSWDGLATFGMPPAARWPRVRLATGRAPRWVPHRVTVRVYGTGLYYGQRLSCFGRVLLSQTPVV